MVGTNEGVLELLGMAGGGKDKEIELHHTLRSHHHRGEWFHWNDEVEAILRASSFLMFWGGENK